MSRVVLSVAPGGAGVQSPAPADLLPCADARASAGAARRQATAALLAAVALALVVSATHARNLGFSLLARATAVGDVPGAVADPSDAAAFEPFAFGVVGPVRGDAAALARSVEALAARGDVRFVVVLGPLTREGRAADETEFLRLAASVRDRGVDVVAVPSAHDLATARDLVQTHLGAARWWFVHRECVFVGLPGGGGANRAPRAASSTGGPADDGDTAFVRECLHRSASPPATIVLSAGDAPPAAAAAADLVLGPEPGVRVVRVTDDGGRAVATVESLDIPTGPTLRTLGRDVSLCVLFPLVRSTAGYVAVLAGATLLLAATLRMQVRAPRA